MDVGREVLTRVALGNAYSSQPKFRVTYTLAPLGAATRVLAHIVIDMKSAFGAEQGMSLDKGKAGHEVQTALEQLKAEIESSG
jgi:hypothetical protein